MPGPNAYPDLAFQYDVWKGGGGNNNWSNTANWRLNAVPTSTSKVLFDSASTTNSVVDADGNVAELIIDGTNEGAYADTLTQSAALTISGNYIQDGGTATLSQANTISGACEINRALEYQ